MNTNNENNNESDLHFDCPVPRVAFTGWHLNSATVEKVWDMLDDMLGKEKDDPFQSVAESCLKAIVQAVYQGLKAQEEQTATKATQRKEQRFSAESLGLQPVDADKAVELAQDALNVETLQDCPDCRGFGDIELAPADQKLSDDDRHKTCRACNGTGLVRPAEAWNTKPRGSESK